MKNRPQPQEERRMATDQSDYSDGEDVQVEEVHQRCLLDMKRLREESLIFDDQQNNLLEQIQAEEKHLREVAFLKTRAIEELFGLLQSETYDIQKIYESHKDDQVSTSALKRSKAIQESDDHSKSGRADSRNRCISEDQLFELRDQKEREKRKLFDKQRKLREFQEEIIDENNKMQQETTLRLQMMDHLEHYEETLTHLGVDLANLMDGLRELNNEYQNLIGTIRVNVRIRPLQENEIKEQPVPTIRCLSRTEMVLTVPHDLLKSEHHLRSYEYDFEQIYDQEATQDDLFRELSHSSKVQSTDMLFVCLHTDKREQERHTQ